MDGWLGAWAMMRRTYLSTYLLSSYTYVLQEGVYLERVEAPGAGGWPVYGEGVFLFFCISSPLPADNMDRSIVDNGRSVCIQQVMSISASPLPSLLSESYLSSRRHCHSSLKPFVNGISLGERALTSRCRASCLKYDSRDFQRRSLLLSLLLDIFRDILRSLF